MTNQIDNWHKLARYDTNIQGELHANLLRNNDITVSLQALSGLPGMNSGAVLWVQDTDLAHAQHILASIDTNLDDTNLNDTSLDDTNFDDTHFNDAELINADSSIILDGTLDDATVDESIIDNITTDDNSTIINKGGNA